MKFILLRGDAPIGEAYRVHGYSWLVIDHEYSYRFPRITPLLVPSPCSLVNSAYSRMHTAPNPLFAALAAWAGGLLAMLYAWLAACLAHPLQPASAGSSPAGQMPFPAPLPLLRCAASGDPARAAFRFAHCKWHLPRRRRGWGASPPKSTLAWARCSAVSSPRFWLPQKQSSLDAPHQSCGRGFALTCAASPCQRLVVLLNLGCLHHEKEMRMWHFHVGFRCWRLCDFDPGAAISFPRLWLVRLPDWDCQDSS